VILHLRQTVYAALAAMLVIWSISGPLRGQAEWRPAFEAASIKLNSGCQHNPDRVVQRPPRPGSLQYGCMPLDSLIHDAYALYADGKNRIPNFPEIQGLPDWAKTEAEDRFYIEAKAPEGTLVAMMMGPMLQRLLEERFKLKLHRGTKQSRGYVLVVSKRGPKMRRTSEDGCVVLDRNHIIELPLGKHYCGDREGTKASAAGARAADFFGLTAEEIGVFVSRNIGQPVVDKTGLQGKFDFHLEFARDQNNTMDAASLFSAIEQQLGLKLEPQKLPVEYLVVDHVERPSAN
jgi:uncharacterized protein (TIGR03435 family)